MSVSVEKRIVSYITLFCAIFAVIVSSCGLILLGAVCGCILQMMYAKQMYYVAYYPYFRMLAWAKHRYPRN
jgi:hypothetical protein